MESEDRVSPGAAQVAGIQARMCGTPAGKESRATAPFSQRQPEDDGRGRQGRPLQVPRHPAQGPEQSRLAAAPEKGDKAEWPAGAVSTGRLIIASGF